MAFPKKVSLGCRWLVVIILLSAGCVFSVPSGFDLQSGNALPPVQQDGALLIQSSANSVIHWDSFSIAQNETVLFRQINSESCVLNRVVGALESQLLGTLQSNGSVYLVNPNGILIGPNGVIETAGFIASTLDLFSGDLDKQVFSFSGESDKGVVNQGIIRCPAGNVFLIGRTVEQAGTIEAARQGLLSGSEVFICPDQAPQVHIRTEEKIDPVLLEENPYLLAIRLSGSSVGNEVYIHAAEGISEVSGDIEAAGGTVHLLGDEVVLIHQACIEVSGKGGGGEVLIGGDYQGKNPNIKNAQHVWLGKEAQIHSDAFEHGNGGKVILWSDAATIAYGTITACGGSLSGDGGLVEISSPVVLIPNAVVSTLAPQGKNGLLYLDPCAVTISTSADSGNTYSSGSYSFSGSTATVNIANLINNLSSSNVIIDATASGTGTASITIANPITGAGGGTGGTSWTNNSLTLTGGNSVTVNSSSAISWAGTGTLTMTASTGQITINSSITNSANNGGTPFNAIVMTAGGSSSSQYGIEIGANLSTVDGNISLTGTSKGTVNVSAGILINSSLTLATSGAGSISFTGTGSTNATNLSFCDGVRISSGETIHCTGTGSIAINGTSGGTGTGSASTGINLQVSGTSASTMSISGSSASISLFGTAGGNGQSGGGVVVPTGITISAPGGGNITLFAVGGPTTSTSGSTAISVDGGTISSTTGSISIAGIVPSGISGSSSSAVSISSSVSSSSGGSIFISGQCNASSSPSLGVTISSSVSTSGTVTFGSTINNPLGGSPSSISGCTGGSGTSSHGLNIASAFSTSGSIVATNSILGGTGSGSIGFYQNANFQSSGGGSISITASSQSTTGAAAGIWLNAGTMSTTSSGTITLNGTSGSTSGATAGVQIQGTTVTSVSGAINITAVASGSASTAAFYMANNGITSTSGPITISGQSSALGTGSSGVDLAASWTPGTTNTVTFSNCSGGTGMSSHGVNIFGSFTGSGPVVFSNCAGGSNSTTGGNGINIGGAFKTTGSITATSSISGAGNGGIGFASSANFGTTGSSAAIAITASSSGTMGASHGISLTGGTMSSVGGSITLIGTSGASSTASYGVYLADSSVVITSTSGAVSVTGTSLSTVANSYGIEIADAWNPTTTSTLSLTGTGGGGSASHGINVGAALTNTGPIAFSGTAGGGSGSFGSAFGANITGNGITVTGASLLSSSPLSFSSSNSSILFNNTIDASSSGAQAFTVTSGASASVTFDGNVGATTPLGTLTIGAGSGGFFIGSSVTTINASSFSVGGTIPTTLNNTSVLTINTSSDNGLISFGGSINGASSYAQALTVNPGTGSVTFSNSVGNSVPLGAITLGTSGTPLTNVTASSSMAALSLTQPAGSGTTLFSGALSMSSNISLTGTNFTLNAPVLTANNVTIDNGNLLSISSAGSMNLNGSFLQSGIGLVQTAGDVITANQNIEFSSGVTLTGGILLDAGTGNLTFLSTVDGTYGLELLGNNITFGANVGGTPLTSLQVFASGTISVTGNQTVISGPMLYSGPVVVQSNSRFTDSGSNGITFEVDSGSALSGNYNVVLSANNGTINVEGDVNLAGSSGSNGGTFTTPSSGNSSFSGQILTQGGANGSGAGGAGGAVSFSSTGGSISVHNINTSGGNGTTTGGSGGNITLQPAGSYSGGYPVGLIILNEDLSGDGNLVAEAGTGGTSGGGTIILSANRTSYPTVATITSSLLGNDISIIGESLVMGANEVMTCLGNLSLTCSELTLGDLIALDSLSLLADNIYLLLHGNESILASNGLLYTSPSLHFLGGSGYLEVGTLVPSTGPLNAQDLDLSASAFKPLLLYNNYILNYDTSPRPVPATPSLASIKYAIYLLVVADAQLSDLLPVYNPSFPARYTRQLQNPSFEAVKSKSFEKSHALP